MKTIQKKKNVCEECGGNNLKVRRTTYPVKIGEKQLDIHRVSVKECMECHHLMPTKAGQDKIERCMMTFMSLLDD